MGNIIKTAIITIIISFISGLLLEYYKNLAPRILCNIRNSMPIKIDNKKLCAYIIAVSNVSNKTIHDLTLYIQSPRTTLRATDAKITKGLKFDSSIENNTLDVYIPFLSKDDKFSVTVYAENQYTMSKPVIIIRSPENFKQIDRLEQNGILSSLLNVPKNVNQAISKPETRPSNEKDDFTMVMNRVSGDERTLNKGNRKTLPRNKKTSNNKKAMIIIVSITLLAFVGVLGKSYLKSTFTNTPTPDVKTTVPTQSTDSSNSSEKATKNTGSKASTGKTTVNTSSKTSTGGSTDGSTENTNSKTSTGETTVNAGSKTSTEGTTKNTDSKAPTEGTTKNTDSKSSTEGSSTGNSDSKAPTGGSSTGNSDSKSSTGGNSSSKTSTGGSTGSTGN
jgi:cytoskeletal protein RodZ